MLDNEDFKMETSPRELTQNPLRKIWLPFKNGHIAQRRGKMQLVSNDVTEKWCRASADILSDFIFSISIICNCFEFSRRQSFNIFYVRPVLNVIAFGA